MVKVRLPDGKVASFPDDMAREQIKAFVAQKYPNAYGEQSMPEFSPEALAQIEANNRAYDDKSHMGWNVIGGALSGTGEGALSGIGRLASGATFGASDWLDRKTGGNLAALDDRLQRRADNAGVGLANKIAKAGTEIVGNIAPGGAITRGLAQKGVKSALAQSAVGGGIGGTLYGATVSDKLSDLPVNMLAGGVGGTAGGAALHGAFNALGAASGLLRSNVKKGMDYLRSKFGDAYVDDMIREAEQKGLSLAEVADNRALKAVQMARQQTSVADDIVTQNAQTIRDNVSNKNTDTLNDMFGTKSGYRMAQEAEQAAMEKARPMFNDLESKGDLAKYETRDLPQQNFNRWFEGSKVVDENGQPLKLYHGTNANFDKFDKEMIGKGTDAGFFGKGFYVTPNKGEAGTYGKNVMPLYTNAKNLYNLNGVDGGKSSGIGNMFEKGAKLFRDLDLLDEKDVRKLNFYENAQNDFLNNIEVFPPNEYTNVWFGEVTTPNGEKILERAWDSNNTKDGLLDVLWNKYSRRIKYEDGTYLDRLLDGLSFKDYMRSDSSIPERFSNKIKSLGYDGINQGDEIVLFEPNQIKSVNNSGAWSSSPSLTDAGWTPESQSKLWNVINSNDVIGDAVKKVKGSYSSIKGLPDTDARVILETRKLLSSQTKSADKTLAYQAKQALKEFDDALPADFRKGLEEANKIYKDNYQFSEAKESASDIFKKNISPEEFSDKFGKMTAEEKQALRGGLRDELFSIIENRANETLGWNRVVPKAVQAKIRRVLGVKDGDKLIEYAQSQLKSMRNLNKILGGSQTSEKQGLRDNVGFVRNIIKRPVDTLTGMLPYANARNKGIAELMTNPSADLARATYEQVASPQGWEAVYQALYNPRGFTKYNTALAAYLAGRELQQ